MPRGVWVLLKFEPELPDKVIYRSGAPGIVGAPSSGNQLVPSKDPPRVRDQMGEEAEFLGGEFDRLSPAGNRLGAEIYHRIAKGNAATRNGVAPPEHRLDAGEKLLKAERFNDVVVCAQI